ncbi:hypothetical protein GBZ26_13780, partial [Azospirillum formosense]
MEGAPAYVASGGIAEPARATPAAAPARGSSGGVASGIGSLIESLTGKGSAPQVQYDYGNPVR